MERAYKIGDIVPYATVKRDPRVILSPASEQPEIFLAFSAYYEDIAENKWARMEKNDEAWCQLVQCCTVLTRRMKDEEEVRIIDFLP